MGGTYSIIHLLSIKKAQSSQEYLWKSYMLFSILFLHGHTFSQRAQAVFRSRLNCPTQKTPNGLYGFMVNRIDCLKNLFLSTFEFAGAWKNIKLSAGLSSMTVSHSVSWTTCSSMSQRPGDWWWILRGLNLLWFPLQYLGSIGTHSTTEINTMQYTLTINWIGLRIPKPSSVQRRYYFRRRHSTAGLR